MTDWNEHQKRLESLCGTILVNEDEDAVQAALAYIEMLESRSIFLREHYDDMLEKLREHCPHTNHNNTWYTTNPPQYDCLDCGLRVVVGEGE